MLFRRFIYSFIKYWEGNTADVVQGTSFVADSCTEIDSYKKLTMNNHQVQLIITIVYLIMK